MKTKGDATFLLSVLCRRFPLQRQLIHSRQLSVTESCRLDPKKNPVTHTRTVKAKFNLFNLHLIPLYYILTGVREGQPGSILDSGFITQLLISVAYWYQDSLSRSNKWLDWRQKTQVQGLLFSDTHHPKSPWECHVESGSSYSYKTFSHPQVSELFTRKMNFCLAFPFATCKSVNMSKTNAWRTKAKKKVGGGTENLSENNGSPWGVPRI